MTNAADTIGEDGKARLCFVPGFIFEPFGWVSGWLKAAVEAEPGLLASVCSLNRQRMHLIALALAHLENAAQHELTYLLLYGRARDVLDRVLGRRPRGLNRAFNNLLTGVLSPEGYRRLVDLLDDPVAFKFLAHADYISDEELEMLASIPAALRPVVIPSADSAPMGSVADGLRFLVMRGVASSFDSLVDELKSCRQPNQLSAHVRKLVDALPLPTEMPAARIGQARRLDKPDEIRELARTWRNCLEKLYLQSVNEGSCAVYLWEEALLSAACMVERRGRLGWFLSDIRGPGNSTIEPRSRSRIEQAFVDDGIFQETVVRAILGLVELDRDDRRPRTRRR